jgi:hypothetical protein
MCGQCAANAITSSNPISDIARVDRYARTGAEDKALQVLAPSVNERVEKLRSYLAKYLKLDVDVLEVGQDCKWSQSRGSEYGRGR